MNLSDKIYRDQFKHDTQSHITIDHEICREKCKDKPCLYVCPTDVFKLDPGSEKVNISFENCLETGACRVACREDAMKWDYPRGGYGISYRHG